MLAFGQAGFGAGGFYGLVDDFGVALCCDLAGFKVVTIVTVTALLTLLGAGCGLGFAPCAEAMTLGGNLLLLHQNGAADRAVLAFGQAGFGAGGFHGLVNDFGVALCCNLAGFEVVAVGAVTALLSLFGAGCGLGFAPCAEAMTLGRNLVLLHQNGFTGGAVLAFRQTGFGAGGFYGLVDDFGVALGCDFTGFEVVAVGAVMALLALFGAGGIGSDLPVAEAVSEGIHIGIHIAVTAGTGMGGVTLFGTSGGCNNGCIGMHMTFFRNINPENISHFIFRQIHNRAAIHTANIESSDGVVVPPFLSNNHIGFRCHRFPGACLHRIGDPAIRPIPPPIGQNDDGANRQGFFGKTDGRKVILANALIKEQFIIACCTG